MRLFRDKMDSIRISGGGWPVMGQRVIRRVDVTYPEVVTEPRIVLGVGRAQGSEPRHMRAVGLIRPRWLSLTISLL
jgi:hypothetical protein